MFLKTNMIDTALIYTLSHGLKGLGGGQIWLGVIQG